jgi:hypothetical protein
VSSILINIIFFAGLPLILIIGVVQTYRRSTRLLKSDASRLVQRVGAPPPPAKDTSKDTSKDEKPPEG